MMYVDLIVVWNLKSPSIKPNYLQTNSGIPNLIPSISTKNLWNYIWEKKSSSPYLISGYNLLRSYFTRFKFEWKKNSNLQKKKMVRWAQSRDIYTIDLFRMFLSCVDGLICHKLSRQQRQLQFKKHQHFEKNCSQKHNLKP